MTTSMWDECHTGLNSIVEYGPNRLLRLTIHYAVNAGPAGTMTFDNRPMTEVDYHCDSGGAPCAPLCST
jgi:hypothetical protein